MNRLQCIDAVRGLVMVIMALDHTRDFLHADALTQDPTDLNTTSPELFFTRWVTHLCAPTFVFLSGTSARLSSQSMGLGSTRSFLFKRGVWLILLEFTLVNFVMWFDIRFRTLMFEVIGAIGFGFIALGFFTYLSPRVIGIVGAMIVVGHGLISLIPFAEQSVIRSILTPLFARAFFSIGPEAVFFVAYPPIPWLGIMLLGYATGHWFTLPETDRKRKLFGWGLAALALFILIRFVNIYGNVPWETRDTILYTTLSFLNISKYPPSLLFTLLTLGCMLLLLRYFDKPRGQFSTLLITYGKVPLFYFIVHMFVAHAMGLLVFLIQGSQLEDLNFGAFGLGRPKEGGGGISLAGVYVAWFFVVLILYPLCKRYGSYKENHRQNTLLRYL